ncbi:MAG: DUF1330 domain-containing protein [Erythrobacter sp.]|uniref:DUF1330 domain-containing protein n=1 Tax=Erythrobacter sp. TaxID=1042 RepID=UPI00260DA73F|nr:DUF1330 domain-containing protein [Erythrobacter sp.]MDJ0977876.1 DUF1330 domain-containing protein [Erythrobacter sp.]
MAVPYIDPSPENWKAFKDLPRDEPIHMLNLLRYRDLAKYPEDHEHHGKGWSGRRAYEEYGKTSGPIFSRVGGEIVWRGAFQTMVTGPTPDQKVWHDGFVAFYPNSAAFLEMVTDPDYQKAVTNRTASLVDSRLMRFAPGVLGDGFG